MPRITPRSVAVLAATLAILASCASPSQPPPAQVQGSARTVDPCRKYERPTDFGRCRLFTSAEGWRFIPEIGRGVDLETQLRCAPVAPDLGVYAECIGRAAGSLVVATPDAEAVEPAAASASQALIKSQPIAPDVAANEFEQMLREIERLDPALWTPPRIEPTARTVYTVPNTPPTPNTRTAVRVEPAALPKVARTIPQAPTAAVPERSTRPLCAENGSCYGDISSYTGRPKTVHVSGYYRKDGTYVRGHYRSRPRR